VCGSLATGTTWSRRCDDEATDDQSKGEHQGGGSVARHPSRPPLSLPSGTYTYQGLGRQRHIHRATYKTRVPENAVRPILPGGWPDHVGAGAGALMVMRVCLGVPDGPRCGKLIRSGSRCIDCRRATWRLRQRHRDPREVAFYGSAAWKRLARAVVDAADACATCGTPKTMAVLTAGHRLSVRSHPDLALHPSNVLPQCRACQERYKRQPDPSTWPGWARRPRTSRW
jgi:hypothetical protein